MLAMLFSPIGRYVGALVAVLAIVGFIYSKGRVDGSAALSGAITEENQEAVKDADLAELGLLECVGVGGVWDFSTSECGRSE